MEQEQVIANLKQELAEARAEISSLKKSMDSREANNKALRDSIKELKQEKTELEEKLPSKDAKVITAEEHKELESYRALGKADLIKIKVEDYDRANAKLLKLERDALIRDASADPKDTSVLRYKPHVLETLLMDKVLSKGKDGFSVKLGDEEKALEKWLEEDMSDFLPALQVEVGTSAFPQAGNRSKNVPKATPEKIAEGLASNPDYQSF